MVSVSGRPAVHRRVQRMVRAWNRSGLGQVAITTRVLTSDRNLLDRIGVSWDRMSTTPGGDPEGTGESSQGLGIDEQTSATPRATAFASVEEHIPVLLKVLSQAETDQFIKAAQQDTRTNLLSAPRATLLNGQVGQIVSEVQQPFVTGLSRDIDGSPIAEIDIVADGFKLSVAPEITEDQSAVDITADLDLSDIKDVQPFSTTMLGEDAVIQMPRVSHLRVDVGARLQAGQSLLVCVPPTYDRKEYAWVMLTPEVVDDELLLPEGR